MKDFHGDTRQFEIAASIFPFDRFIESAPAYIELNETNLKRAFKYDPYAMDLRKALAVVSK
jgi:hypothetical protein